MIKQKVAWRLLYSTDYFAW